MAYSVEQQSAKDAFDIFLTDMTGLSWAVIIALFIALTSLGLFVKFARKGVR